MKTRKKRKVHYLIITITFVLALSLIPLSILITDDGKSETDTKNKVSLQSFDIVDISASTNSYARVENIRNDTITIRGRVVENTNGYSHSVESLYREGKTIKIVISGQKGSDIVNPLLTGYKYNVTVRNIQENDTKVEVIHKGEDRFSLDMREGSTKSEQIVTNMSIEDVNQSLEPSSYTTEVTNEKVVIDGHIVSLEGGSLPTVKDVNREYDTLNVVVGFNTISEFSTRVVRGYDYKLSLYGFDSKVEDVNVIQKSSDLSTNHSVGRSGIIYDFDNRESEVPDENQIANITDVSEDRFTIRGSFLTGSSTCSKVGLSEFRVENQSLHIHLVDKQSRYSTDVACTDDIGPSPYQITVLHRNKIQDLRLYINKAYGDEYYRNFDL